MADQAGREGWTFSTSLRRVCETEISTRARRRAERFPRESHLPDTQTMAHLDQARWPAKTPRQLPALVEDDFVGRAENGLAFGLPGRGKTHLLCAGARELVPRRGDRAWFTPTVRLAQQLLIAKRDVKRESLLRKRDGFEVILLDDIGCVQQSREDLEVLFTFLSERYERKSRLITRNVVFSEWDKIFKDPMTPAAAMDRLAHHSIIVELDGDSYRMAPAKNQKNKGNG